MVDRAQGRPGIEGDDQDPGEAKRDAGELGCT
jgi:hypothetical protein